MGKFFLDGGSGERASQTGSDSVKKCNSPFPKSQTVFKFAQIYKKKILTFMSLNKFQYEIWCMINLLIFFVQ